MATLNTDNPEYLQWNHEQVQISILGGIRIEGLDRMRVTLKIEYKEQVVRHNLDLYNDASVDRLVKRCAERFSLGTVYVSDLLTALVNDLEQYRLEELKKGTPVQVRAPLSAERIKQVTTFLKTLLFGVFPGKRKSKCYPKSPPEADKFDFGSALKKMSYNLQQPVAATKSTSAWQSYNSNN